MPNIVREELWKYQLLPAMFVVTTNATVKLNGSLVMGRGAALQAKEYIHGIDKECGVVVERSCKPYGFLVVREPSMIATGLGIFQVKDHYRDRADARLIEISVMGLIEYATFYPHIRIRMNYPGIGYGRLGRKVVEPLLTALPDNVTICYR